MVLARVVVAMVVLGPGGGEISAGMRRLLGGCWGRFFEGGGGGKGKGEAEIDIAR